MEYDLIVVGAGAAGLLAAGRCAELGQKVLVVEKMKTAARKLRITGKGRCNLTNTASISEYMKQIGKNSKFLKPAFSTFFNTDLIRFFNELGVETVEERGNRVFPVSQDADQIADTLIHWAGKHGVRFVYGLPVMEVLVEDGKIKGVRTQDALYHGRAVLLATGGASYPGTGSNGDGYRLSKQLGHTVTAIRPALVSFITVGDVAPKLQGLSLKNVQVNAWVDGRKQAQEFGEMLFTHYGLSGPIILTLSRELIAPVQEKRKVVFSIDLKPALDDNQLDNRLQRDLNEHGKMKFIGFLKGLLPGKLTEICCDLLNISPDKLCNQISANERKQLRLWLKDFKFEIAGPRPFSEAIITSGGVEVKEIEPKTMESKLVQGLYFAGELMDVDANTGGYNLQIAFSTAWLAAQSMFSSQKDKE